MKVDFLTDPGRRVKKPNLREEMETRQERWSCTCNKTVKKPNLREEMETRQEELTVSDRTLALVKKQISARRWKHLTSGCNLSLDHVKKPNLREEMETRSSAYRLQTVKHIVKKPNLREEMETRHDPTSHALHERVKKPNLREEMETRVLRP